MNFYPYETNTYIEGNSIPYNENGLKNGMETDFSDSTQFSRKYNPSQSSNNIAYRPGISNQYYGQNRYPMPRRKNTVNIVPSKNFLFSVENSSNPIQNNNVENSFEKIEDQTQENEHFHHLIKINQNLNKQTPISIQNSIFLQKNGQTLHQSNNPVNPVCKMENINMYVPPKFKIKEKLPLATPLKSNQNPKKINNKNIQEENTVFGELYSIEEIFYPSTDIVQENLINEEPNQSYSVLPSMPDLFEDSPQSNFKSEITHNFHEKKSIPEVESLFVDLTQSDFQNNQIHGNNQIENNLTLTLKEDNSPQQIGKIIMYNDKIQILDTNLPQITENNEMEYIISQDNYSEDLNQPNFIKNNTEHNYQINKNLHMTLKDQNKITPMQSTFIDLTERKEKIITQANKKIKNMVNEPSIHDLNRTYENIIPTKNNLKTTFNQQQHTNNFPGPLDLSRNIERENKENKSVPQKKSKSKNGINNIFDLFARNNWPMPRITFPSYRSYMETERLYNTVPPSQNPYWYPRPPIYYPFNPYFDPIYNMMPPYRNDHCYNHVNSNPMQNSALQQNFIVNNSVPKQYHGNHSVPVQKENYGTENNRIQDTLFQKNQRSRDEEELNVEYTVNRIDNRTFEVKAVEPNQDMSLRRQQISNKQLMKLEFLFKQKPYPSFHDMAHMGAQLGLGEMQVYNWFKNRRINHHFY